MLMAIILACGATEAVVAPPLVSEAGVATAYAGRSGGPYASIELTWLETNVNRALHTIRVYENGVLVSDGPATASYTKDISGYFEYGPDSRFTSNWTYRVDLIRISDSAVISQSTSAVWAQIYGTSSERTV